jgi:hypothetical protein
VLYCPDAYLLHDVRLRATVLHSLSHWSIGVDESLATTRSQPPATVETLIPQHGAAASLGELGAMEVRWYQLNELHQLAKTYLHKPVARCVRVSSSNPHRSGGDACAR